MGEPRRSDLGAELHACAICKVHTVLSFNVCNRCAESHPILPSIPVYLNSMPRAAQVHASFNIETARDIIRKNNEENQTDHHILNCLSDKELWTTRERIDKILEARNGTGTKGN